MFKQVVILITLIWSSQAIAGIDEAMDAYNKGDFQAAEKEFQVLAEQGNAKAQYTLGMIYDEGQGVTKDPVKGVEWFRKAAEQGYVDAQFELGYMYALGRGTQQDFKLAAEWYRKAAEHNHASAQYLLGGLYYQGKGVAQDNKQAYMWYSLAFISGEKSANLMSTLLAARMTPSDVEEAKKMTQEWSAKHPIVKP